MSKPTEYSLRAPLVIIAMVAVVFALVQLKVILVPFTLALLLTFLTHPLLVRMTSRRIPSGVAVLLLFLLLAALVTLLAVMLNATWLDFQERSGYYYSRLEEMAAGLLAPFKLSLNQLTKNGTGSEISATQVTSYLFENGWIQSLVSGATSLLSDSVLILILWVFMISGKSSFEARFAQAFPADDNKTGVMIAEVSRQIQSYIAVKSLMNLSAALLTAVIFGIFGVDFLLLWTLLTFILHFIPNFGSILSVLLPGLFMAVQFGFTLPFFAALGLAAGVQFAIGNFVEPHYFGKRLDLNPVVVLLALLFWGWVWGIPGMFLAIPLTAILKIVLSGSGKPRKLSVLMGS